MLQNKTYAKVLESQGFFKEAFAIYKKLLKKHPNDIEIKQALKRLKKYRITFDGVNEEIKQFFIEMETKEEFRKFEEWLLE